MDNYQISRDRAVRYFLGFDQEQMIRTWRLRHDDDHIWLSFLGKPYYICRGTGRVIREWSGEEAEFSEVLSIFDLLCHEGQNKCLAGEYAPVNSLRGRPRAVGVGTSFHTQAAKGFDADLESFSRACAALGGEPVEMGDLGFRFPLFRELSVVLKFYRADEDFPASVTLLWDANTLQYIFYETVFYIAGVLLGMISREMEEAQCI